MILSNLELGETSISDLLKRQLVKNLPISFNSMQSNDILVNSITCVSFYRKYALKVASISKHCHFSLYGYNMRNQRTP
jgi:hypothetical protein